MSRDGKRRVLSYEERVLWTTVSKTFKPLREDSAGDVYPVLPETVETPKPRSTPPRPLAKAPKLAKPPTVASYTPPPQAPPPNMTPLSRRMRRGVARGKQQIDARLDLHGLTQHEAHAALLRFLKSASARDARLVLVITGKGKRADGDSERGVLRRQVPQWLGLPEFRGYVVGFEDAHIAHGGEGALYVRVRRSS
jgi:DNA-nicking Smr family endonuclease